MLTGLKILLAAIIGIALGLAATYAAVDRGLDLSAVRAGPWIVPTTGDGGDLDPYEQASLAKRAEIPLGLGEGMSLVANRDSSGRVLDGRCDYLVSGQIPAARYWTLSAATPQGRLIANPAERYGFTSAELLRGVNGAFTIEVDRFARPGNWLPLGRKTERFVLDLRLYDTPVVASAAAFTAEDLPNVVRKECE